MKKLLNTLYLTKPDLYLSKQGDEIAIRQDDKIIKSYPHHILDNIICFSYLGASPAVMKLCMENQIGLSFHTPQGQFCGRVIGKTHGNVLLRRKHYHIADEDNSLIFAKNIILAKISNTYKYLIRFQKDHKNVVDNEQFDIVKKEFKKILKKLPTITNKDTLRGLEGQAAALYFGLFNQFILTDEETFHFDNRSRRPPKDPINALLSFGYSMLAHECQSALESVGLDSYVGFFHTDQSGRASLALDLMEEFRCYLVDRFVISLINNRQLKKKHFFLQENGSVLLTDNGRTFFLDKWQQRKHDEIKHPFINEYVPLMLLPYVQAQLMVKTIYGELDEYPPFMI